MIYAGVMGDPVSHSLSPTVHGYWLKQYNIKGRYDRLPTAPENLEHALRSLLFNGFAGVNLTLPHKHTALAFMDSLSPAAAAAGAVNTVTVDKNGRLYGDNTDIYGFTASLDAQCPNWHDAAPHAVVIGAGGAARAVIYALHQKGINHIAIANRTRERTDQLIDDFSGLNCHFEAWDLTRLNTTNYTTGLLINATSLGMVGAAELVIRLDHLKSETVIADIVYRPRKTKLLEQARACGLKTAEGIDMLIHQAVPGFDKWFGIRPTVTAELKEIIAEAAQ